MMELRLRGAEYGLYAVVPLVFEAAKHVAASLVKCDLVTEL